MRTAKNGFETYPEFDKLLCSLLHTKQNGICGCGVKLAEGYQLAHKRYGDDITLNDLGLKCGKCHAEEHGYKGIKGKLRYY